MFINSKYIILMITLFIANYVQGASNTNKLEFDFSVYYSFGTLEHETVKYIENLSLDTNNVIVLMNYDYFSKKYDSLSGNWSNKWIQSCTMTYDILLNKSNILGFVNDYSYFPDFYFKYLDSLAYDQIIEKLSNYTKQNNMIINNYLNDKIFTERLLSEIYSHYSLSFKDSVFLKYSVLNKIKNRFDVNAIAEMLPKNKKVHVFYSELDRTNYLDFFDEFEHNINVKKHVFVAKNSKGSKEAGSWYNYSNKLLKTHRNFEIIDFSKLPRTVRFSKTHKIRKKRLKAFKIIYIDNAFVCFG